MTASRSETEHEVLGPWSLAISKAFWEGFAPSALPGSDDDGAIHTVFLDDLGWSRVEATVTQEGSTARVTVTGEGDLDAATDQVLRFLSLDIDARAWPEVGMRDPVIAEAQHRLAGLRPCGFHSPYEAATWAVLTQRIQIRQAASLRARIVSEYGERGAFPSPQVLLALELGLPGRKDEYLRAVAEAALDGQLSGARLRQLDAADALAQVQQIKGLGPFAAELVVIRGANFPDVLPGNEGRLEKELSSLYGDSTSPTEIARNWQPFRSWASVYLRASREYRTHEIERGRRSAG